MVHNIFEITFDRRGYFGLQSKDCKMGKYQSSNDNKKLKHRLVLIAWRSPYASADHNVWLEQNLKKLYTKYYMKVLIDNMGYFWD